MDLDFSLWSGRFSEWMRLRNWSEQTITAYGAGLKQFFVYLRSQGVVSLGAVTRDLVEGFRTHLFYRRFRGKTLSVQTQASRLQAVKSFMRYLAKENYLLVDVASTVDLPKRAQLLPLVLSELQTVRFLEEPDVATPMGIRDRAIVEVLYATAVRNGELCSFCLDDIDRERPALWVRQGKGQKSRLVPLGEEALVWLDEYLARVRPLWASRSDEVHIFLNRLGRPMARGQLQRMVHQRAQKLGLIGVRPHTLRHSCATHMLAGGAGLRHVQELLGHASPVTTGHYTQVEISDLHKVLRRCHPREKRWGQN
jgi:integrase/recombinase XerD